MQIALLPYTKTEQATWDELASKAVNGHFMFQRAYMDYHQDRFEDASFVVLKDSKPIALLPGCRQGKLWNSHAGLSFGGLIIAAQYNRTVLIGQIYKALFERLRSLGFDEAFIKPVSSAHHKMPAQGEMYVLHHLSPSAHYIETNSVIDLEQPIESYVTKNKRASKKIELKTGVKLERQENYEPFWAVLTQNLNSKFGVDPVHSLEEMHLLASRFPNNIELYTATDQTGDCLAGVVMFNTERACHAQYISSSERGRKYRAMLPLLFHLIEKAIDEKKRYFSLGISTENNGEHLNESLIDYKERFGSGVITHHKLRFNLYG